MGKTIRRYPRGWLRSPRGHKQALSAYEQGELKRMRAVPPDSWEDIRVSREALLPFTIANRMEKEGYRREDIIEVLIGRFRYTYEEACDCAPEWWWTL